MDICNNINVCTYLGSNMVWLANKTKYESDLYQSRFFPNNTKSFINFIKRN